MDPAIQALPMVGDVNMFFKGVIPTGPGADFAQDGEETQEFEAEIEIMIAEPAFRRKGLALEALQLMLEYATGYPSSYFSDVSQPRLMLPPAQSKGLGIPPSSLVARISDTNTPSIRLFELLGFRITRRVAVFNEVELRFKQ
ncbi:hypothetical protein E4T56_gene1427 [Termitomyces sp. T112]|nr:hypothetical protein E4T56_gene1427 [Termitomyces sp. T112]